MSSFIRRMTRNQSRTNYKGTFGMKVGYTNPTASDLLACNARRAKRKERSQSLGAILEEALRDKRRYQMRNSTAPSNGFVDPRVGGR